MNIFAFIAWFVLTLLGVVCASSSGQNGGSQLEVNIGWLFHLAALSVFIWVSS